MELWEVTTQPLMLFGLFLLGGVFQAIMWLGVFQMGKSWRVGIDDQNPGKLKTEGIFQISRNPIFFGLDGIVIVVLLLHPNLLFLIFTVGFLIGLHIQIIREEKHLEEEYGEEYSNYKEKTARYLYFF
jgi:protein-S-isoprenylcysteine O-methyltransferase Ste14